MFVYLFFLLAVDVKSQFDYTENGETEEYSLYMNNATNIRAELFTHRNYDKFLAPVFGKMPENYSASKIPRMRINFLLNYAKLLNLDAQNQILSAILEIKMDWRDPRLVWNSTRFGGIEWIFVSPELLWVPDTRFGNAKVVDPVNGINMPIARIHSNGSIYLSTAYYAETDCGISSNTFPFDKQNCTLEILSLTLETKYISFGVSVANESMIMRGNGEWEVMKALSWSYISSSNLEVCGFMIYIKRVPNFYVYVIALPCFVLTILSIIGMFWSPNVKKEQLTKLSIGLTSLVSMTVLLQMLANAIPKTQVFPLLGIYVVSCVGITSLACVTVVMHPLPNSEKQSKKELEKLIEANEPRNKCELVGHSIKEVISHRHCLLQLFFQGLNIVGFIVFLSFWHD